MPRIGNYREALEAQASKAIGVPVRIGAISATSEGFRGSLFPTFELRDVVLRDAQQREALRLARVVASMSPRSLWNLRLEQLYVEGPVLDIRMDTAGKLHVAGLGMDDSGGTSGDSRAADWVFSQGEIAVRGGTLRWTDERRNAPPLLLTDVDFVARNGVRRHQLRLDATPPADWGARWSLRGDFRQPLLSTRRGAWKTWTGPFYADLPRVDVRQLGQYVALDQRIREGNGALRLWGDLRRGEVTGGSADVMLHAVDVTLAEDLQPLVLRGVAGRLDGQWGDGSLALSTQRLQFETHDGLQWPGGNVSVQRTAATARNPEHGRFQADRLDLAMITQIADRLPLAPTLRQQLLSRAPRGLVQRIDLAWQGDFEAPERFQAKGRVADLALASIPGETPEAAAAANPAPAPARPAPPAPEKPAAAADASPPAPHVPVGVPGVRGATIDFDATQAGGSATVAIQAGAIDLPGVFEEPVVPIDSLSGRATWKRTGEALDVKLPDLRFANADAQGEARIEWRTSDPASSRGHGHFPGVLDMEGKLTRADGTRVHRYLPLEIPQETRHYVRDAVTKGTASTVDFRVRGDLFDMPFLDPRHGEFRILAKVADVNYAYVPPTPGAKGPAHSDWPALTGVSGELLFERAGMHIRNVRGRVVGAPGVEVTRGEAAIDDMSAHNALLKVDVQAKGPLASVARAGAPLLPRAEDRDNTVRATFGGDADYKLHLHMPLAEMDKTEVQASVALADNQLQLAPDLPAFTQVKGTLNFTETGFAMAGLRGRLFGGEVRLEGKGRYAGTDQDVTVRAQGVATAEGLRAAREAPALARLGESMRGSTPYTVDFRLRDKVPEFLVTSNLQGMALSLPAPLAKAAEDLMPLRLEKKVLAREGAAAGRKGAAVAQRDMLSFEIGSEASVRYVRDISGATPRVLFGGIAMGQLPPETTALPDQGVQLNVNLPRLDMDAWKALAGADPGGGHIAADDPVQPYLPTLVAVRAQQVQVADRTINQVVMGATREGTLWRMNVDSDELSGYLEYRAAQAGRLVARLARLKIARSDAPQVESLLDEKASTLPALDVVVDDFELLGKQLGRAEIDAVNRGGANREWRVNRLTLTTPEAKFSATGSWATEPGARGDGKRRTAMDFTLDMDDAGLLLTRLGMPGVLRRGHGKLAGAVAWRGSPFSIDYPSLDGQMHVDVASGQFLKAEPGLAKLLGVLSLQALPRRLTLDFRDIFSAGFAFDVVRGDAKIDDGVAATNNLQMRGVAAEALMDGSADIAHETQNLRVVVVPEISGATASLLATAINPAFGLGTYLAQLALRKPLTAAATQEFEIAGTWSDPQIKKVPRRPELDVKPGQAAAPAPAPTPAPDAAPQPLEPKPEKTR